MYLYVGPVVCPCNTISFFIFKRETSTKFSDSPCAGAEIRFKSCKVKKSQPQALKSWHFLCLSTSRWRLWQLKPTSIQSPTNDFCKKWIICFSRHCLFAINKKKVATGGMASKVLFHELSREGWNLRHAPTLTYTPTGIILCSALSSTKVKATRRITGCFHFNGSVCSKFVPELKKNASRWKSHPSSLKPHV